MKRRNVLAAAVVAMTSVPLTATRAMAAQTQVETPAEAENTFVRWLSTQDPRAMIRSRARAAILSTPAERTTFLAETYTRVLPDIALTRARQTDYATRMVRTHPAIYYPWVNATGLRALDGAEARIREFSSTDYTAALTKDRDKVPFDTGAAGVVAEDRAFVAELAVSGLSPVARERAARAVTAGTDADIAEFLLYRWAISAEVDIELFRTDYVAAEFGWWTDVRKAVVAAESAEQLARDAVGDAAEPARAAAVRAWEAVGAQAATALAGWAAHQRFTQVQIDDWQRTATTAAASTSPTWRLLKVDAPAVRKLWLAEQANAAARTAWWTAVNENARARVAALTTPAV
ncbi:hypothetical protein ACWT_3830 [Actinoplanes sp. SE50]|uniref:hypothetical protein n=1 Tax=unclassified Actinoplanes TaxID=2626549 RepID=UPI00023ECCDE|nr:MULTISPECIES: hypothetical protein [unclassified Actinoplanes]AEV84854.1 hypothetical protein ACPL_3959 [Actinoplanes sp. SE50/110]ATO83245.1 hypothetical protein ACWT_3830 [Actinoplanes sp. SE50]SLM00652.1 uncharacterized protein ACSP50_3885 [Actinoplanes sp. SE50/110]